MTWKKLGEKYLFQHKPWLTIREDRLQMPNGNIMESYYLFEYPDWVNTIAIDKEGNFILVEQYRHAVGQYGIELCAGVCDKEDDSPLMSAQRELLEETGYGGGSWEYFMTTSANPGTHTNRVHGYIARGVEKLAEQSLDRTEEIIVHVLKREEVLKLLKEDKFLQSLHSAILWKYFALVDPV
jgi:ADP-ribose pyrophosphatase